MIDKDLLLKLRQKNPIVLNIANTVTQQHVADAINFLGASPIMFSDVREAEDLLNISNSLVINLGTPTDSLLQRAIVAGQYANKKKIPIIIDPVAVGASQFRRDVFDLLVEKVDFSIIRGNVSEIATICDLEISSHGIDVGKEKMDTVNLVVSAAQKYQCVVVITGETDFISDGTNTFSVKNGDAQLKINVGSGDMLDGIIAAFYASEKSLCSIVYATAMLSVISEIASNKYPHRGYSFFNEIFNLLATLSDQQLVSHANIERV